MTHLAATAHTAADHSDTGSFFRALQATRCLAAGGADWIDALTVLAGFALARGPLMARAQAALREALPVTGITFGAPVVICASGAVVDTATGKVIGYDNGDRL